MQKRALCLVLIIFLAFPLLGGCTPEDPGLLLAPIADAFFQTLLERDYGACYDMLAAEKPEELTRTAFISTYQNAYDLVRLQELRWNLVAAEWVTPARAMLHYTLTYQCDLLEPFTQDIVIPVVEEATEWRIVWSPSMIFTDMTWDDKVLVSTLRQKRGEILDRDANAYAINSYGATVYVLRSEVVDLVDLSARLAALTNMDAAKIREIINEKSPEEDDYAVIKVYAPNSVDQTLEDLFYAIPAVGIDYKSFSPMRYYPQGSTFSHTLGYTRPIEGEVDPNRYDIDSRVGANGLELAYEDQLAGYRGREISLIAPDGAKKASVIRKEPIDGVDLELTLDFELQLRAETLLSQLPEVQAQAGAIVCIDPKTGDLLAAAAWPTYDPNMFSFPIPADVYQGMLSNEANRPFLNRVTSGTYPPGSTVKPLVAAMALDNDVVPEDYVFNERIDWAKRQWLPTRSDWSAPPITRVSNYEGPVNFENAIVNSDNIFFADLALRAGWDNLDPFLTTLGFGEDFPFEIPVTSSTIRAGGSLSNLQLLASSGFGQGEMTVSPLQMAYTFSLFANDGDIMRPRLVSSFKKMDGVSSYETVASTEPALLSENLISDRSLEYITPMLRKVVTNGSARNSRLADIETLGKTGTAEVGGSKEREIAWSIIFVRGMEYERLVCVVLEVPTDSETAGSYRHTCVSEMLAP